MRLLDFITQNHTLVLSSFIIEELIAVTDRKFPAKKAAIDQFLSNLGYELVYTPIHLPADRFEIRDKNDYPVLYTAIMEDIDILITGDKDFFSINIEKPEILTPSEFLRNNKINPQDIL